MIWFRKLGGHRIRVQFSIILTLQIEPLVKNLKVIKFSEIIILYKKNMLKHFRDQRKCGSHNSVLKLCDNRKTILKSHFMIIIKSVWDFNCKYKVLPKIWVNLNKMWKLIVVHIFETIVHQWDYFKWNWVKIGNVFTEYWCRTL